MSYTFKQNGKVFSTGRWATIEEAADKARIWLLVSAENDSFPTVQLVKVEDATNEQA